MTPARIAELILASNDERAPGLPSGALLVLAREYMRLVHPRERLGEVPQMIVTATAARTWGDYARIGSTERAREELTELLIDAEPSGEGWRLRTRTRGIEIDALTTDRGRLRVVTSVVVQPYPRGGK